MKVGDSVRFIRDVELQPDTVIRTGETGVITDMPDGAVEITLDKWHDALWYWRNTVLVLPGGTPELEGSFRVIL